MTRFNNPLEVEKLRGEIYALIEPFGRQLYLNDFPHPSPYWTAQGQNLRHYVLFLLRTGGDKRLKELKAKLETLFQIKKAELSPGPSFTLPSGKN